MIVQSLLNMAYEFFMQLQSVLHTFDIDNNIVDVFKSLSEYIDFVNCVFPLDFFVTCGLVLISFDLVVFLGKSIIKIIP